MTRPQLEVADIFRRFGPAWRAANAGHLTGCPVWAVGCTPSG